MFNPDRLTQTKTDIVGINIILQQILKQLAELWGEQSLKILPSISNPPSEGPDPYCHYPEPQCERELMSSSGTCHLKPATLSEFLGDCTKGGAFLNLCKLYINLVPH